MSNEKPNWSIFLEDLDGPSLSLGERAHKIADILESGNGSPLFVRTLAEMIRPDGKHSDLVLKLQYKRDHEPRRRSWRIAEEMRRLRDDLNLPTDEAVYQIQKEFGSKGTSRSRCLKALQLARALEAAFENVEGQSLK